MSEISRLCQKSHAHAQRPMSCMESCETAEEHGLGFESTFASFALEF